MYCTAPLSPRKGRLRSFMMMMMMMMMMTMMMMTMISLRCSAHNHMYFLTLKRLSVDTSVTDIRTDGQTDGQMDRHNAFSNSAP